MTIIGPIIGLTVCLEFDFKKSRSVEIKQQNKKKEKKKQPYFTMLKFGCGWIWGTDENQCMICSGFPVSV